MAIGAYCNMQEYRELAARSEEKWDCKGQKEMTKNRSRGEIMLVHGLSSRSTERQIQRCRGCGKRRRSPWNVRKQKAEKIFLA